VSGCQLCQISGFGDEWQNDRQFCTIFSPFATQFFLTMAKAKKTRKFAATKRLINVKRDTRLKSVKEKLEKKQEKKEHELVREV
jgi:poly-D-alanine transfer protein DltD